MKLNSLYRNVQQLFDSTAACNKIYWGIACAGRMGSFQSVRRTRLTNDICMRLLNRAGWVVRGGLLEWICETVGGVVVLIHRVPCGPCVEKTSAGSTSGFLLLLVAAGYLFGENAIIRLPVAPGPLRNRIELNAFWWGEKCFCCSKGFERSFFSLKFYWQNHNFQKDVTLSWYG